MYSSTNFLFTPMDSLVKWIPLPPELVYALVHQNALLVCEQCQLWEQRQPQPCADCGVDNLYCTSCVKQCEAGCCYYCPTCAPKRSASWHNNEYYILIQANWYACSRKVTVSCYMNKDCSMCCKSVHCFLCGNDACCKHHFIANPYPEDLYPEDDDNDWWPEVLCGKCYSEKY